MNPTFALGVLAALTVLVGVLIWKTAPPRRRQPPKPKPADEVFRDAFVDDPDLVADEAAFSVHSRDGRFAVAATRIGNNEPQNIWDVVGPALRIKGRTIFRCAPEGMLSGLFDTIGLGDVKTGDEAFDRRALLTGSDRDVVRALACQPEVRRALEALLDRQLWLIGCEVDHQGVLRVRFYRSGTTAEVARDLFRAVARLADALDAAADIEPLPPPLPSEPGSVSSSSGAPVGLGARV